MQSLFQLYLMPFSKKKKNVLDEIYTTKDVSYIYKYMAIGHFYSCIYHVCNGVLLGRAYGRVF